MTLLTINSNAFEPQDYTIRKTVKAVIVNDSNEILLFGNSLVGGGVEEGETDEQALYREAMEEVGMRIEIKKPIGEVIQYRDVLKKKYIVTGYVCKYISTVSDPTSDQRDERGIKAVWKKPEDVIVQLESEIMTLRNADQSAYEGDSYQSKLYNRETTVALLKELKVKNFSM